MALGRSCMQIEAHASGLVVGDLHGAQSQSCACWTDHSAGLTQIVHAPTGDDRQASDLTLCELVSELTA